MKRNLQRAAVALIALALCLAAPLSAAQGLTVSLGVKVTLEGTLPKPAEAFAIRLEADDPSSPMPAGSAGGRRDLSIEGAGSAAFSIAFGALGIHRYTVRQIGGGNADCTYDQRVYRLIVHVLNAEGGGLEITSVLYEDSPAEKLNGALFHNVYATVAPTPTPTPKDGDATPTGVRDNWPYYLLGAAALLALGIGMGYMLRRKEDKTDAGKR